MSVLDTVVPERLQPLWRHPAGPKTIFFWAPMFKWGLVLAGIGDMMRPAGSISQAQCLALLFTGLVWSRYSMAIIPKNYPLFWVNVFIASTQSIQLCRSINYQMNEAKSK